MANGISKQLLEKILGSKAASKWSRITGRLADARVPTNVLKPIISIYSAAMKVNAQEYIEPKDGFASFNDFFGRHLKDGERDTGFDPDVLVSPCDGRLTSFGNIDCTGLFEIKKSSYTLAALLGSEADAAYFADGTFAVVYLHPRDYHRVHAPCSAELTKTRHIPGACYPVTGWCEAIVDNIYEKNERMIFFFDLPNNEKIALCMVAALNVGNIESQFRPNIDKQRRVSSERAFENTVKTKIGEELGAFLLGSTVVLLGSKKAYSLNVDLTVGPTKLGVRIGTMSVSGQSNT